jgi:hypothetical protein
LTSGERLERADREVESLKQSFIEAVEQIRQTPEADGSFEDRWVALAQRVRELRTAFNGADYDKDQVVTLTNALLDMRDLLDRRVAPGDLDVCDGLLIALERARHVVRDALDEHVNGVADDTGVIMEDLDRWLPDIPDRTIAELVGVDRRTLGRWRKSAGTPPRRELRTFARLVAILRHNWDEDGIVGWFERPRRDLGGRKPASLLVDPNAEPELISAARSGRSQYAT